MNPRQPSLFDILEKPVPRTPPDLDWMRRYIDSCLRVLRQTEAMTFEAQKWRQSIPIYLTVLPAEEAAVLQAELDQEWDRLSALPVQG